MDKKLFSVEEVADYLKLNVKTIRRYIYSGKISANKIGGQWRISKNQLDEFVDKDSNKSSCSNCEDNISNDDFCVFMDSSSYNSTDKLQICSIIDYYTEELEEISKISEVLLKVVTNEAVNDDMAKFNYVYDRSLKRARFVLWGSPSFINKASKILIPFEGEKGEKDEK